ncbi:DUF3137 domain-containing protein [Thiotrichales bacterium HSG1]|nr:DUF3137 domain-containing protein [Thiotrichales bacterium HSG1]
MKTQAEIIVYNKGIDTKLKYVNVIIPMVFGLSFILLFGYPIAHDIFEFSSSRVDNIIAIFILFLFFLLTIFGWYRDNLQESYLIKIDKEIQLKEFYANYLKPKLNPLEKQRKNILLNIFYIGIGLLAISIISSIFFAPYLKDGESTLPVFLILSVIILLLISSGSISSYKKKFKTEIIRHIVAILDDSLIYYPYKGISYHEFQVTELEEYWRGFDSWSSEDYVEGMLGKTSVKFSEIDAEYHDDEGNSETVFHGLFFIFDFNKAFEGFTVVVPKGNYYWNSGELVKLESPEFEQEFSVYSDNQITARYILSPSLMQRILKFKYQSHRTLYLSFVDGKLYIAISFSKLLFEPRVFSTLLDYEIYRDYFTDMLFAKSIVEELNLNRRIWSKGSPSFDPKVVLRQDDLHGMIEK